MPKKMDVNTKAEAARAHQGGGLLAGGREPQVPLRALPRRGCREARRRGCPPRRARAALARRRRAAPYRMAARVGGPVMPKVTEPELLRRREEERLRLEREAETAKKRQARKADEEEYERVVLVANTNRDDSIIEARSVEDAIAKMFIAAEPALPPDRHPERRLKVSYKAFEEADLAKLKEEKPVLTTHQYKDMI